MSVTGPWRVLRASFGSDKARRSAGWCLERLAMAIFGTGELAMRAVPLLFGMATVGMAAWIGRRWMGRIAGAVLVVLCWLSPALAHYRFEVKHYTADAFFGLLLPALAAWAIEADRSADRARRIWVWWIAAAIGHWFSNGAFLVTPACAIFLCVVVWRRDGRRAALWLSTGGLLWLVSFGLHYLISVRYTHNSPYLRTTWITEILPLSLGLTGTVQWFLVRLEPLALNPGGTALATTLWISAICWLGIRRHAALGTRVRRCSAVRLRLRRRRSVAPEIFAVDGPGALCRGGAPHRPRRCAGQPCICPTEMDAVAPLPWWYCSCRFDSAQTLSRAEDCISTHDVTAPIIINSMTGQQSDG